MMIFKYSILFILIIGTLNVRAGNQLFLQGNKNPVLFHPSNAGSKKAPRFNFGGGIMTRNIKEQLFVAGADHFFKGLKSGIGIYYLNTQKQEDVLFEHLNEVGIAIAPKLNIMSKSNHLKARYTLSPSIFFNYAREGLDASRLIDYREYSSTVYSPEQPSGYSLGIDSVYTHQVSNGIDIREYEAGLGFQLIGNSFFVQLQLPYAVSTVKEKHGQKKTGKDSVETFVTEYRTFYTSNFEIGGGYSIPINKGKKIFLTSVVAMSYRYRWNKWSENESDYGQLYFGELRKTEKGSTLNYGLLSLLLRYDKLLIGGAVTYFNERVKIGGSMGYQQKKLRFLASVGFVHDYATIELITTYVLKTRNR